MVAEHLSAAQFSESLDLAEKSAEILRALDKLAKAGREKVLAEVKAKGIDASAAVEFIAKEMSTYGK